MDALENELRNLPELQAPQGLWERVRERLDEDGDAAGSLPRLWSVQRPLAAAAGIALFAAATVLVSVHLATGDIEAPGGGGTGGVAQSDTEPPDHADIIEALMVQSRQAEDRRRSALAFYSPSGPEQVLRAQIGGIDAALNEQVFAGEIELKSRESLLRDRVELMADLTDIERYRQHEFVQQVSF